jgi:hypothetical protein
MTDILGVDIGLGGGLAVVRITNGLPGFLAVIDMPVVGSGAKARIDAHAVAAFLQQYPPSQAVLEHTQAFPGQGRSSIFSFGRSTGTIETVLALHRIPIEIVQPNRWKQTLGLSREKEEARALALRLYPAAAEHLRRKLDHGRAEALLLAHWFTSRRNAGQVGPAHKPDQLENLETEDGRLR